MKPNRRAFLGGFASLFLLGAAGPADLRVVQLQTQGNWNSRPHGMPRLLWETTQRTSIEVDLEVKPIFASDPKLYRHPLIYWTGSGAFAEFSQDEIRQLRRYLMYGGTIIVDSSDAEPSGSFDLSVRRAFKNILPDHGFERLDANHVAYKSFYLVDQQAGRTLRVPYLETIMIEKRAAVIYSQNDLGGAWSRDPFGRWEYQVTPGGERQREMAFRLGINLLMYALCLDYKADLVHAPFILKRRR
jgi:hypothetical protein